MFVWRLLELELKICFFYYFTCELLFKFLYLCIISSLSILVRSLKYSWLIGGVDGLLDYVWLDLEELLTPNLVLFFLFIGITNLIQDRDQIVLYFNLIRVERDCKTIIWVESLSYGYSVSLAHKWTNTTSWSSRRCCWVSWRLSWHSPTILLETFWAVVIEFVSLLPFKF